MKGQTDKAITAARIFTSRLPVSAGSGLIVAPVCDVLILLMIFFVMGSSLLYLPGVGITLPQVDEPSYDTVDRKLVITMTSKDDIFFNNQPVRGIHGLNSQLEKEFPDHKPRKRLPVIILYADKDKVTLQDIARIMALCSKYRTRLFIATEERKP